MSRPVQLLWTGGWDSSFRLLYLLLVERRSVQPIYVVDPTRGSTRREIWAMDAIRDSIQERLPEGVALYRRQVYIRTDFGAVPELRARFDALQAQTHVGGQYVWLAEVAEALGWRDVEMCVPRHEPPSALQAVIFEGLETDSPRLAGTWEAELFSYWRFPVLTLTKQQMGDIAARHGFLDALENRWFCFSPTTAGRACGTCRPCRIASQEGMTAGIRFVTRPEQFALRAARGLRHRARRLAGR